jgi:hypothetical protein
MMKASFCSWFLCLGCAIFAAGSLFAEGGIRFLVFSEPIVEGVYEGMNVPDEFSLTLGWYEGEDPEAPMEVAAMTVIFGSLTRGPEIPAGTQVFLYAGTDIDPLTAVAFGEVVMPSNATEVICYLIPIGPNRFRPSIHDVSPGLIAGGSARLVNVSDETLAAMIDEERGILAPGEVLVMPLANLRQFQIQMRIAAEAEEGWRPVHAARISAQPNDRLLVLISRRRGDIGPWRVRPIHQR